VAGLIKACNVSKRTEILGFRWTNDASGHTVAGGWSRVLFVPIQVTPPCTINQINGFSIDLNVNGGPESDRNRAAYNGVLLRQHFPTRKVRQRYMRNGGGSIFD
jgi:hypothetical protein